MANATFDGVSQSATLEVVRWKWPLLLLFVCSLVALRPFMKRTNRNPRNLPLPPGPKGVPIFGNLFQLAKETESGTWKTYSRWATEYASDLVYVEAMGQPIVVLNSYKAVRDLLERRAPNYSDRFISPALSMIRNGWAVTVMNYGPWWRSHRRAFHQHYNSDAVHKFHPVIEHQTLGFLRRLVAHPKGFLDETKYLFGSIIIQISYGLSDPKENAKLVDAGEALVMGLSEVIEPGRYLVDTFPFLRHVPLWFPGAGWRRRLEFFAQLSDDAIEKHFDDALEREKSDIESEFPNVAHRFIEKLPTDDDPNYASEETVARNTTLVAYVAGSDTTVSSAHALYIALVNNPDVQRRAQSELDVVVGPFRLPKPSDLPQLHYIRAIVKEISRWHNPLPMAIPHVCREDDEYNGHFIPKGTLVLGNTWAIMHSEAHFEDAMDFKPERYLRDGKLSSETLDPEVAAFGFGRRICPGRHLSNAALTYMVASLLAVFNVERAKDPNGKPIDVELETTPGFIIKPIPFDIDVVPRSKDHAAMLSES